MGFQRCAQLIGLKGDGFWQVHQRFLTARQRATLQAISMHICYQFTVLLATRVYTTNEPRAVRCETKPPDIALRNMPSPYDLLLNFRKH